MKQAATRLPFLVALVFCTSPLLAQFEPVPNTISSSINLVSLEEAADLEENGKLNLVSSEFDVASSSISLVWLRDTLPPCLSTTPPQNPTSAVSTGGIALSWDPVVSSIGCQIAGTRISPVGPTPTKIVLGLEPSSIFVPTSFVGAGTTWFWRVRCACSISPFFITSYSANDTFTVPLVRHIDADQVSLFPNPADAGATLVWESIIASNSHWALLDLVGRTVASAAVTLDVGMNTLFIPTGTLTDGVYFLQVDGQVVGQLQVAH